MDTDADSGADPGKYHVREPERSSEHGKVIRNQAAAECGAIATELLLSVRQQRLIAADLVHRLWREGRSKRCASVDAGCEDEAVPILSRGESRLDALPVELSRGDLIQNASSESRAECF